MSYSHEDVLRAQFEELNSVRAKALGDYESSRLDEDAAGAMAAATTLVDVDSKLQQLDRIVANYIGQKQQPAGNKYGLSSDEVEIAHGIASNDRTLSPDDRERVYAENRHKLRQMRASGMYRDDQGQVRR